MQKWLYYEVGEVQDVMKSLRILVVNEAHLGCLEESGDSLLTPLRRDWYSTVLMSQFILCKICQTLRAAV